MKTAERPCKRSKENGDEDSKATAPQDDEEATTTTTTKASAEEVRKAMSAINSGNPIFWKPGNFVHERSALASVECVINNISKDEYAGGIDHHSGNLYFLSYEQLINKSIQEKLLSDIIPELIEMITKEGFDVNRIDEKLLDVLLKASENRFPKDYANNDDRSKVEKVGGSVYLKFIVMTVGDWIKACNHLLRGDKRCVGRDKMFIDRFLAKLNLGIDEGWWTKNETYSIPYIGESSAQSFWMRMSNYYPPLYKAIMEKTGDINKRKFEIKVGQVGPNQGVQSRALESLVATLLSRFTQQSRQTAKLTKDGYDRCRCLRLDGSGLNDTICGDRIGFGKFARFDGYKIYDWFGNAIDNYRNVPILDCTLRNAVIVEYVLANVNEICDYINNTPRENASKAVRSNKGAPSGKRVNASHITVEDGFRYWGYIVGSATLRDGKGIHNLDWLEWQEELELDDAYNVLKKEYDDDNNWYDGYFFPDANAGSSLYKQFHRIRKGSYAGNDFRREFFLSKKEFELEHLLDDSKYQEVSKKKTNFRNYGAEKQSEVDRLMQNDGDDSSESSMAIAEDSSGSD